MVSEKGGILHDAIPIPVADPATLASRGPNFVDGLQGWFPTIFEWTQNSEGKWVLAPRAPVTADRWPANPVEELFIDADIGYRTCFAPDNAYCLPGWQRRRKDDAEDDTVSFVRNPAWSYSPATPLHAFGGNVLQLYTSTSGRSHYALTLDASAGKVTAELVARLKARKIPFVRTDQCPQDGGRANCSTPLNAQLGWQLPIDQAILSAIDGKADDPAVFVLPTVAVAVYPLEDGSCWIKTVARYNAGYRRRSRAVPAD